jgi:transposase InsO family protein
MWLGVSKSGFYEWRSRPESATAGRRERLKLLITRAFEDSDGTYGYRRIWWQLARWDVPAGPELVRALMRELGLVACQPRPWRPVTTVQGQAGPIPDLVNRDFSADVPGHAQTEQLTGGNAQTEPPCVITRYR